MAIPLRLLLVEDSEDDAALLLRELRRGGYDVAHERVDTSFALVTALNNQNGISWSLTTRCRTFPVIDALNILRSNGSEVPFIFVSGTHWRGGRSRRAEGWGARLSNEDEPETACSPPFSANSARPENAWNESSWNDRCNNYTSLRQLVGWLAESLTTSITSLAQFWAGRNSAMKRQRQERTLWERLQKIIDQTQRAAGLTSQLLSFARRQDSATKKDRLECASAPGHQPP